VLDQTIAMRDTQGAQVSVQAGSATHAPDSFVIWPCPNQTVHPTWGSQDRLPAPERRADACAQGP